MMRPAIELQEKGEAFYFIADYHSMTSLFDAAERRKNTLDVALDFLACGLDPKKSVFFKQSDVPEVTELGVAAHRSRPWACSNAPQLQRQSRQRASRPITACSPIRC
jgi:tryptophanyl-tRNA synthetase